MGEHFTRILCAAAPRGSRDAIEQLREVAADQNVDATVVIGDLRTETLGRSTVVAPGGLADGHYALADVRSRDVELGELVAA
jgi:Icc-related predicted phosphoesterase